MDGKTMRGTLKHERDDQPPVHLLSLYECESGILLGQVTVREKENEITAAPTLLHPALVKGRIITADAMHTQIKFCILVYIFGGHYLLIAKKNQPGLLQDLVDFFSDKELDQGEWQYHKDVKGSWEARSARNLGKYTDESIFRGKIGWHRTSFYDTENNH